VGGSVALSASFAAARAGEASPLGSRGCLCRMPRRHLNHAGRRFVEEARSRWLQGAGWGQGLSFRFFFRIPPFTGNEISAEISPNFANSERKENSNSKNEISVNSDRNFGDFDRNFGDFDRKMMSVVIFLLFPRSNEKLLNTNFVQFFEIYNFCFRNFFI